VAASRDKPALLVIDMISLLDFPGARRVSPGLEACARQVDALRTRFHREDWPVVYANDHFAHWRTGFDALVAMAVARGGVAATVARMLAPHEQDYVVAKPKHSAFLATPLAVLLAKLGVRRLLLSGMALENCVLATALDANAREYEVAVAKDACTGDPRLAGSALALLAGNQAARVLGMRGALRWARG
jgi:nicotinamidase-related amidase